MFCRKYNNKKYCVHKVPKMNARDIVLKQLREMKNNNRFNSGIMEAYYYASIGNRMSTGPYDRFVKLVKNPTYKHLLNSSSYRIINEVYDENDMFYKCEVKVYKGSKIYIYIFELSRQFDFEKNLPLYDPVAKMDLYLYWRTNSVMLKEVLSKKNSKKKSRKKNTKLIENYQNNNSVPKNIHNKKLQVCSTNPMTGYYRTGYCNTDEYDQGTHVVCAEMDDEFLKFTKSKGNDLSTPSNSFPGLKKGDKWCLCALRWKEAMENGKAPKLDLGATEKKALEFIAKDKLKKYKLN